MLFELTEELTGVRKAVREFAKKEIKPVADSYCRENKYPRDLILKAAKLGYIASFIPQEYDGVGGSILADTIIKEEITAADPVIGMYFISHIGAKMIIQCGTEEQKRSCLPPIARGDQTCGIAMTEPQGGSNVSGIQTRATEVSDGYVMDGTKTFITNASSAEYLVVIARTSPEEHRGLSTFIVETKRPGIDIRPIEIMGGFPPPGEVAFNEVKIPKENLLGEINRGFYQTMDWLDRSRSFITAYALGIAQGAFELALEYSKTRTQFGEPICNFQAIGSKLADMAIKVESARLMAYKLAAREDTGKPDTQFASMAKLYASEAAEAVASEAVMIHGAYGTSTEYPIHKYYACAKVSQIIEGTSQIHREVIARRLVR